VQNLVTSGGEVEVVDAGGVELVLPSGAVETTALATLEEDAGS
jgi:hypothetical protein